MPDTPPEPQDVDSFAWIVAETLRLGGQIWDSEKYIVVYVPGEERVVVAFDNLASVREKERRLPWSYELIRGQGWGCIGVMAKTSGFFQSPDLHEDLDKIKHSGIFEQYDAVSFYGASAGGFAAAAFAGLSPGATVVAMSPQSSLSSKHAPFETRYRYAKRVEGWNDTPDLPYRDAIAGIQTASKAYLIYDPMEPIDSKHITRLRGDNTTELRAPNFSHKLPPVFKRMGALKQVALGTLTGEMAQSEYYKLIRLRKTAIPYSLQVIRNAIDRGHLDLAEQGARFAIATNPNWKLRQILKDILDLQKAEPPK